MDGALYTSQNAAMPLYAETERLRLRSLEKADLARNVALIGEWEVARWLVSVPYPYSLNDAEDFCATMAEANRRGQPELFVIQPKQGAEMIGAVGLHPSREPSPQVGELVVGYWLGKDYWGQGFMSEAIKPVIDLAFRRNDVALLTSTTDPANKASQNILHKAGFTYLGITPRGDGDTALRGSLDVTRWQLTREDYERKTTL